MRIIKTSIPDICKIEPDVYIDERGFFYECYNENILKNHLNQKLNFVQENHSYSNTNVLRGLHYQIKKPQGKLLRVTSGKIFDVAVDLRKKSPTYKKWTGEIISADNKHVLWIPPGFAHGFYVVSDSADVIYKVTEPYAPEYERTLAWDDPELNISWPLKSEPILSEKDKVGKTLEQCEVYE